MRRLGGLDDEAGFTLVELMVVLTLTMIVMSIAMTSVVNALQTQRRQVEHVEALNSAKMAMERVTREIRAANPLLNGTPGQLEVRVTRGDEQKDTTYTLATAPVLGADCSAARQCLVQTDDVTDLVTSVTTTSQRVLARGLAMQAGEELFRYVGMVAGAEASLPATELAPVDAADVSAVEVSLRMALDASDSTVALSSTITLRNAELEDE